MKTPPYRIFLSPPYLTGSETVAMDAVMASNWLAPVGPALATFEADLCRYTNAPHAVALQSGSAALHLSMVLLGVGPGDEVFVSTYTHNATVNCICYQGAKPVFIDANPGSWNLDIDILEAALEDRATRKQLPKAIIVVHLYGNPVDMVRVMALAKKYNIPVVEDAAEALGSTLNGQALGTFGDLGVLSFNGNKIITTTGGGALLTPNAEMAEKALFLATQARDAAPYFQHSTIGYNYRLSNLLAAFGSAQLTKIDEFVAKRQLNFQLYGFFFKRMEEELGYPVVQAQYLIDGASSNHWLSCFIFHFPSQADRVISALESAGIEARYTWKPMHLQPVFEAYEFIGVGVADLLFESGVCLPSGFQLTPSEHHEICSIIKEVLLETL